jgi:predicted transcriptional regulator
VNKTTIKRAVDTLLDWKIISFEYGETDKKRATRLYKINPPSELLIGELWKNYWNTSPIDE